MQLPSELFMEVIAKAVDAWRDGNKSKSEEALVLIGKTVSLWIKDRRDYT
jgi:hypothetical protein